MLKCGMARKKISKETEKLVVLKSRRRCCLCYWQDGVDEVQKGQIAHLDQNNQNAQEANLVWLCLDHHDEYDGTTRIAKGLVEAEVKEWRDELYKDMEHKFGSRKQAARVALGEFLEEGRGLKVRCANEQEQRPEKETDEWAGRVEEFLLQELDESYIARFRNSAGLPMSANSIRSIPHRNLWGGINSRLARLEQFLAELAR